MVSTAKTMHDDQLRVGPNEVCRSTSRYWVYLLTVSPASPVIFLPDRVRQHECRLTFHF